MHLDRDIGKRMYDEIKNKPRCKRKSRYERIKSRRDMSKRDEADLVYELLYGKTTADFGKDPDHTRRAIEIYGLEGLNAAVYPERYPVDNDRGAEDDA